eukprot:1990138-Prymnesium_polylepis.1
MHNCRSSQAAYTALRRLRARAICFALTPSPTTVPNNGPLRRILRSRAHKHMQASGECRRARIMPEVQRCMWH